MQLLLMMPIAATVVSLSLSYFLPGPGLAKPQHGAQFAATYCVSYLHQYNYGYSIASTEQSCLFKALKV